MPASERDLHVTEFMNAIRPGLAGIPDAEIAVVTESEGGRAGSDLLIEVLSSNPEELEAAADSLFEIVRKIPGLVEAKTSREMGKPEIVIFPQRRQLSQRGLNTFTMGMMLRAAYEGVDAGVYREEGEEYKVRVKYAEADRQDPGLLSDMPVPSRAGFTVPLSDIAELSYRFGDSEIQRKDKQRMIEVMANISMGSLSEARSLIDNELEKLEIPPSVTIRYGGMAEI